jgi:ABC-type Na+ efflux pump permease subunit
VYNIYWEGADGKVVVVVFVVVIVIFVVVVVLVVVVVVMFMTVFVTRRDSADPYLRAVTVSPLWPLSTKTPSETFDIRQ